MCAGLTLHRAISTLRGPAQIQQIPQHHTVMGNGGNCDDNGVPEGKRDEENCGGGFEKMEKKDPAVYALGLCVCGVAAGEGGWKSQPKRCLHAAPKRLCPKCSKSMFVW